LHQAGLYNFVLSNLLVIIQRVGAVSGHIHRVYGIVSFNVTKNSTASAVMGAFNQPGRSAITNRRESDSSATPTGFSVVNG
jgi:hypothetical protein